MKDQSESRHPIGLTTAICLVIGNMIGAGVFTTSGYSLAGIGNRGWVLAAWLLGGLIALCGAVAYGALARRITDSGGEYLFLSRTIHPIAGFLAGWVSFLAGFTGAIAASGIAFEVYAFDSIERPSWLVERSVGVIVILGFGLLHSFSMRPGLLTQNMVVFIKLLLLLGFILFAFAALVMGRWQGFMIPDAREDFVVSEFATALIFISFCYAGFNAAVYVTAEVEDPQKNVPRALWIATAIVAGLYFLLNGIFLFAPAPEAVAGEQAIAAIAARVLGGQGLAVLVQITICLALLSSVSSMIVAGPRVYAMMARDGVFPKWFASGDQGTQFINPRYAIWLQSAMAAVCACLVGLDDLLMWLGFTLSLSSAAAVICIFIHRGDKSVPKRHPLVLIAAGVYVFATLTLAILAAIDRPYQFQAAIATIASGVVVYFAYQAISRKRTNDVSEE